MASTFAFGTRLGLCGLLVGNKAIVPTGNPGEPVVPGDPCHVCFPKQSDQSGCGERIVRHVWHLRPVESGARRDALSLEAQRFRVEGRTGGTRTPANRHFRRYGLRVPVNGSPVDGEAMSEEMWHEARLIPTSGINGADEQERRATSALLAVLGAVTEFGRGFVRPFGAISGNLECYIEVPFILGEKRLYPDGLIRVTRGSKSWTALVEVKTGSNELATEQLENYLDIAREQGFDAVITISNEIPAVAGQHPTKVDKRKLRKVALHHIAWSQVLTDAVVQKEFRGVADPDQAWILGELIRYLEHQKSGALEFSDMGEAWVSVRDSVAAGTLRPSDKGISEVVARFDALLRFASLQLGRQLGTEVVTVLSRKEAADPVLRAQSLTSSLCASGELSGAIRIPDTVGHLVVTADLKSSRITCHVDVDAPGEGRGTTRVNWLVRQLKAAPDTARVEAFAVHSRGSSAAELLGKVRGEPALLVADASRSSAGSASHCPAISEASAGEAGERSSTRSCRRSTSSMERCTDQSGPGQPHLRSSAPLTRSPLKSTAPCRPRSPQPTTRRRMVLRSNPPSGASNRGRSARGGTGPGGGCGRGRARRGPARRRCGRVPGAAGGPR